MLQIKIIIMESEGGTKVYKRLGLGGFALSFNGLFVYNPPKTQYS